MAITKVTRTLLSTGIVDNSNATAITIDSSERVLIGTDSGDAFNDDAMLRLQRQGDRVFQSFKVDADQEAAIFFGDVDDDVECGIQYQAANRNLIFSTGNNAEALRIDSSGNVGIGASSPSKPLHLKADSGWATMRLEGASDSGGELEFYKGSTKAGSIFFNNSNALSIRCGNTQRMKIHDSGCIDLGADVDRSLGTNITTTVTSGSAGSGFWLSTGNSSATSSKIITSNNGSVGELLINQGSGVNGGSILFSSCDSEKMRINSNGQVCIGNSDLSGGLINMRATPSVPSIETRNSTTGATHYALFFRNSGGSQIGFVKISNTGTEYNTTSDYRLKENAEPIQNGLERLNQLNPVKFDWKEDGTSSEGFIAHEVQAIFPDAVSGEKDDEIMQGMDYGRITPLLVKAIQEQQTQIDALKSEINLLKGE